MKMSILRTFFFIILHLSVVIVLVPPTGSGCWALLRGGGRGRGRGGRRPYKQNDGAQSRYPPHSHDLKFAPNPRVCQISKREKIITVRWGAFTGNQCSETTDSSPPNMKPVQLRRLPIIEKGIDLKYRLVREISDHAFMSVGYFELIGEHHSLLGDEDDVLDSAYRLVRVTPSFHLVRADGSVEAWRERLMNAEDGKTKVGKRYPCAHADIFSTFVNPDDGSRLVRWKVSQNGEKLAVVRDITGDFVDTNEPLWESEIWVWHCEPSWIVRLDEHITGKEITITQQQETSETFLEDENKQQLVFSSFSTSTEEEKELFHRIKRKIASLLGDVDSAGFRDDLLRGDVVEISLKKCASSSSENINHNTEQNDDESEKDEAQSRISLQLSDIGQRFFARTFELSVYDWCGGAISPMLMSGKNLSERPLFTPLRYSDKYSLDHQGYDTDAWSLWDLQFSADGKRLFVKSNDGEHARVRILDLSLSKSTSRHDDQQLISAPVVIQLVEDFRNEKDVIGIPADLDVYNHQFEFSTDGEWLFAWFECSERTENSRYLALRTWRLVEQSSTRPANFHGQHLEKQHSGTSGSKILSCGRSRAPEGDSFPKNGEAATLHKQNLDLVWQMDYATLHKNSEVEISPGGYHIVRIFARDGARYGMGKGFASQTVFDTKTGAIVFDLKEFFQEFGGSLETNDTSLQEKVKKMVVELVCGGQHLIIVDDDNNSIVSIDLENYVTASRSTGVTTSSSSSHSSGVRSCTSENTLPAHKKYITLDLPDHDLLSAGRTEFVNFIVGSHAGTDRVAVLLDSEYRHNDEVCVFDLKTGKLVARFRSAWRDPDASGPGQRIPDDVDIRLRPGYWLNVFSNDGRFISLEKSDSRGKKVVGDIETGQVFEVESLGLDERYALEIF